MTALVGSGAVVVGLLSCLLGIGAIGVGLRTRNDRLLKTGAQYSVLTFVATVVGVVALEVALLADDFSLAYVAGNSTRATPLLYKISTLWGGLEGSILFWALILTGYIAAAVWWFRTRLTDRLVAWALLVMLAVAAFFFALMVGPSDPFATLADPPADGTGLNPLLRNHPLMAIHPLALYLGYVGFTVPFAFAVAALVTGRLGEGWLIQTRAWTMFAWGALTLGIVLGGWWSYEVLGWGGYWAWDPVENVSFLPWLTGTAYVHSVIVQERRGMLRVWNLSLLLATFGLTILGTFLTRSGVLDSVHEFSNSSLGPLLLAFFGVVAAVSLGLIFWRGERLRSPGAIDSPLSRESAFLVNNLLFAVFAFVILLGTVFPLVVEAVNDDRIAVGSPYFDRMSMPIGLALLFLMGLAVLVPWRTSSGSTLADRAFVPAWVGAASLIVALLVGATGFTQLLAITLAGFAGGAAVRQFGFTIRRLGWRGCFGRSSGGMVVHLGVVLLALGFVSSQSYSSEGEFTLAVGDRASVAGHEVEFLGLESTVEDGNLQVTRARVRVDGGRVYEPAVTRFPNFGRPIGTPSVRVGAADDVYLALLDAGDEPGDPVVLRVIVQPLVVWLWVGGLLMGLGTVLAIVPVGRRARLTSAPVSDPPPIDDVPVGSGETGRSGEADDADDDVPDPTPAAV